MKLRFIPLALALLLAGCGRSPDGLYQSIGSEDKFRMTLDLAAGGKAKFTTHANLGNGELDRAVEGSMSVPTGSWKQEGTAIIVTGTGAKGMPVSYRFVQQKNGELIWDRNGARLVKTK
jgi:hypothetical protein